MKFSTSDWLLRYPERDEISQAVGEQQDATAEKIDLAIAEAIGILPPSPRYYHSSFLEKSIESTGPKYMVQILKNYSQKNYSQKIEKAKGDFTDKVPPKTVFKEPKNYMGGILGYTVLNEGWIVLRDDLIGETKDMVDVHESIHTNNEYETRVITDWMMSDEPPRNQQY